MELKEDRRLYKGRGAVWHIISDHNDKQSSDHDWGKIPMAELLLIMQD